MIVRWRGANGSGEAWHLIIVPKTPLRQPAGLVSITVGAGARAELRLALDHAAAGDTLLFEAAEALTRAAFLFGGVEEIVSRPYLADPGAGAALRQVGFIFASGLTAAGVWPEAGDRHILDRATWRRGLHSSRIPQSSKTDVDTVLPSNA